MKTKHSLKISTVFFVLTALLFLAGSAGAHCQIPCGIYDDAARVLRMQEDARTILKSVMSVAELNGKNDPQSQNQRIRWVMNKENHAQHIIDTISNYFLTQRVKPDQKDYAERLARHHAVMIAAMKTKQSAAKDTVIQLQNAINALEPYYPEHDH